MPGSEEPADPAALPLGSVTGRPPSQAALLLSSSATAARGRVPHCGDEGTSHVTGGRGAAVGDLRTVPAQDDAHGQTRCLPASWKPEKHKAGFCPDSKCLWLLHAPGLPAVAPDWPGELPHLLRQFTCHRGGGLAAALDLISSLEAARQPGSQAAPREKPVLSSFLQDCSLGLRLRSPAGERGRTQARTRSRTRTETRPEPERGLGPGPERNQEQDQDQDRDED